MMKRLAILLALAGGLITHAFAQGTYSGQVDILSAYAGFTPSAACGSATIVTNNSRFKIVGKITFVTLDVTITALGTCTLTLTFTAPSTALASTALWGQEIVNTGKAVSCFLPGASASVSPCRRADQTNFAVNDRIVINGVYENQ